MFSQCKLNNEVKKYHEHYGEGGYHEMINNENGSVRFDKAEKVEAFNCARCDDEMLAAHAKDWQDPNHPEGEKIKMCESYYGLVAVIDEGSLK